LDINQLRDRVERLKAQIRAKGEPAFRVVKRQFGNLPVDRVALVLGSLRNAPVAGNGEGNGEGNGFGA
jgi:hypothetical protein